MAANSFKCIKGLAIGDCPCLKNRAQPREKIECGLREEASRVLFEKYLEDRDLTLDIARVEFHQRLRTAPTKTPSTLESRRVEDVCIQEILRVDEFAELQGMERGLLSFKIDRVLNWIERDLRDHYQRFLANKK